MSEKTVLVVEDEPDIRTMLRTFLRREGCKVVEAADGEQGVSAARRERPDLILMDLQLPHLDGIAAARLIRETEGLADVPIIAMSAYGEKAMNFILETGELGEDYTEYITKPINMEELKDLLERFLT